LAYADQCFISPHGLGFVVGVAQWIQSGRQAASKSSSSARVAANYGNPSLTSLAATGLLVQSFDRRPQPKTGPLLKAVAPFGDFVLGKSPRELLK